MSREPILRLIFQHMMHDSSSIRVATVWCLINLTWTDDAGSQFRVARLKALGFEERLKYMHDDVDLDVKDRVKTAMNHFANAQ